MTAWRTVLVLLIALAQLPAPAPAATLSKALVDRVARACVLIQATEGRKAHSGSGFFVGANEILTNYHVVQAAAEGRAGVLVVVGTDPRRRRVAHADMVAADEERDLALLRTTVRAPATLRFASERTLELTEQVWAAGFPFGTQAGLEVTMTAGTISALRRDETGALAAIQLDAAINPGNSGGPVVDARGLVVGVTRSIVKPKVGSGMAYAIPCGVADQFVRQSMRIRLRKGRVPVRGTPPGRAVRIVAAEKAQQAWGTIVRLTVRGVRRKDNATPFEIAVLDRRREVLGTGEIDPAEIPEREQKVVEIRLRGVRYEDIFACEVRE